MAKAQNPEKSKGEAAKANRLAGAYSPYLRQHAHNPVDWYPWGEKALARAKTENKPILLSVGYSTCYWCHVLERETFTDPEIARLMNETVVSIKVDRETRPDIDEIYMLATQIITGGGGWPNNVLLTPDLKPFYAVTYLPKDRWRNLIESAGAAWGRDRATLEAQAQQVTAAIAAHAEGTAPGTAVPDAASLAGEYFAQLDESYDARNGGFGAGAKFPQEANLLFLLEVSGDRRIALAMAENTVAHMLAGGIHDHAGGGFHRYAIDQEWLVPHFEKMLYNQGLLASILAQLYGRTGKPEYSHALSRLLDFVARDMTAPGGAFYSAWDAETDAVEGDYYVWNEAQLEKILGRDDYGFLLDRYALAPLPHFPGHKYPDGGVLHRKEATAPDPADTARLDAIFAKLLAAREKREKPLRDDKIIVSWNGMMIAGLADAGRVLKEPAREKAAEKAAQFLLGNMRSKGGSLYRVFMGGKPHQDAFLDDYAWLARGLMALHRATGDKAYLKQAQFVIETADKALLDPATGSYYLSADAALPVRLRLGMDGGALPNDNAVMAHVFVDLYQATGEKQWRDRAEKLIRAFAPGLREMPAGYGHMIHALLRLHAAEDSAARAEDGAAAAPADSQGKVKASARIVRDQSTATKKTVAVTLAVEDGWHVNANPASLDFLIPTVADIQTAEASQVKIAYPAAEKFATAVGPLNVWSGTVTITATVTAKTPIDEAKMRLLLQAQACKEGACLPPAKIAVGVER